MIKKLCLFVLLLGVWSGYASATCSTNNGSCSPFKGETQPTQKQLDNLWINTPEPEVDPGVKRTEELHKQAKAAGEMALSSSTTAKFDPRNVNGVGETWCMSTSMTLSDNMKVWVKRANWSMHWNTEYDYPIDSEFCVSGSFQQAVNTIASSYMNAQRVLRLDIYPNQSVIVFSSK